MAQMHGSSATSRETPPCNLRRQTFTHEEVPRTFDDVVRGPPEVVHVVFGLVEAVGRQGLGARLAGAAVLFQAGVAVVDDDDVADADDADD